MAKSTIKVILGNNIKREAVLIDPNVSASEPTFATDNPQVQAEAPNNVIAAGENSRSLLRKLYGR
jgi:hypothetical protein